MAFLFCLMMILSLQTCNRQACGDAGAREDAPAAYMRVLEMVTAGDTVGLSTGELTLEIAKAMAGTKYVAGTLEHEPEQLRVSLDSTDCILFVELCCSFALAMESGQPSYALLKDNIRRMRYRDGVVNGYTSRIHYTSEWLARNAGRGVLEEITAELGGVPLDQEFSFMSTHPDSYMQLKDNPAAVAEIAAFEDALNKCDYYCLPQEAIASADIRDGDIICFVSKVNGLDISHVALACENGGKMCFIHASSAAGKVIIDSRSIAEYASNGIRVARLK